MAPEENIDDDTPSRINNIKIFDNSYLQGLKSMSAKKTRVLTPLGASSTRFNSEKKGEPIFKGI
jgi:hypothetical protein